MAKSYIFDANKTTPAEVARRRKIAEALAGPYRPTNIGEGLSAIGAAFGSRIAANRASKAEQAGYAHAGEVMSPIFEGFFGGGSGAAPAPAMADAGPASYTPPADADALTRGIAESANALGISPVDLATAISYETGGTFDPLKKGPTTQWGQHRGLIQFGEPQARQNGVDWNDPLNSQLGAEGAVVNYLRNAGVKPGMGLLDIYSAINAGAPGLYNRSDANNGGAPGTIRDKVEQQMAGHIARAQQMFANNSQPVQVASAAPQSLRDGVRAAYASLNPAGGAAAPVSAPPPQAPGPQVAQAQPQGGQPQPKLGQSMVGLPTLLKAAQDPWVAQNPLYSGIINQLIGIELKARMPMSEAEKMDLDMKRLQLEKTALELNQMRNPKPETTTINGNLVNSQTGEVIGSYPDPTKAPTVQKLKLSDGSEVAVQWDGEKQGWVPINAPEGGGLANPKNKLTESQSKLTLFQSLQTETQPILLDLEKQFNPGNLPDAFARGVLGGNFLQTREGQIYNSAATAWAEGALRIATGAAATPEEMERTKKAYFAQPGDSPETIAFKAQMREMYNRSIQRGLGEKDVQGKLELPMDFAAKVQQDGGQGGVPEGVDPALWEIMTPEEKALWQN